MKADTSEHYSIYPGEFVSSNDEATIIERLINTPDGDFNLPYVNMKELIDEYKIEIAMPGIEKQNLIVFSENKLLLICAANISATTKSKTFQRHIHLPEDADAELAIAEYKNNILHCYIPKTKQICNSGKARIVVY